MNEPTAPNTDMVDRTTIPDSITPPSTDATDNAFDDLDSLAREMNDQKIPDDFDRAYDWSEASSEDSAEDPADPEEDAVDPVEVEGQESTEEGVSEEGTQENFYDTERDFPGEKVAPTVYKDRISLDSGVAAKINYAREQIEKLEQMGADLGAIDLPDIFQGQEDFVKQPFDRESFLDVDDESAKKAAFQMDKFINSVKNKVSRIETEYNSTQEKEQVTQEYNQALDGLVSALETAKIPVNEATQMTQAQIEKRIQDEIVNYKENVFDDVYTRDGIDAANEGLRKLEQSLTVVQQFPEVAKKYKEVSDKPSVQNQEVSKEQMQSSFEELQKDQPELEMFKAETDLLQRDFLEYVRLKIEKGSVDRPGTARAWLNLYRQHQSDRMEMAKKIEARRSKQQGTQPKPKPKPPVNSVRRPDYSNARSSVDDVDAEIDELAREMNQLNQ